jgi:transposase
MVDTPLPGSMPRRRQHRLWSAEEKRAICQQTRAPGVSGAQVARRHALNANLIFKWLRDSRFAAAAAIEKEPVFLPVEVREGSAAPTAWIASPAGGAPGRVAIVLATGHRMTVEGPFDGDAVARLLRVLTQR